MSAWAEEAAAGDVHDFDFLVGHWDVVNRRLKTRHANSDDWDEFPAHMWLETRMGGVVNVDQIDFPTRGFSGVTVRALDASTKRWSIYWINSTVGEVTTPVVGTFSGDRGEFYGKDVDGERDIDVRFVWTKLGPDAARWEQAFSLDGVTWETNWTMAFSRRT